MSNQGPEIKRCQNCKIDFEIEAQDFGFYEKMGVLPPGLCPDCRMRRKLIWRNERTFYKRNCDLCGKSIISIHHPSYPSPVYCFECHHSDGWGPHAYGVVYNPERPFFEQFGKLLARVPKATTHVGTGGSQNVNSEYVNFAGGNKNCYLIFNSTENENCAYSRGIIKSKDAGDIYFGEQLEHCYEGVNVNKSNAVFWSQNAVNCLNSYFLMDCADCQYCFGCVNLRHKSYYFWNEPLSKEEWEKKTGEVLKSYLKIEEIKVKFREFSAGFPRKENSNFKAANCFGDYIFESKNCVSCFETFGSEDCKYSVYIKLLKDGYDVVGRGIKSELLLETVGVGHGCSRVIGSWSVEGSHDVEYSYDLRACSYCLGCVGLKHAEYCILNRKYSEADYRVLREKIIAELKGKGVYGIYLPSEISPWAYNETLAQENYPTTKEEAVAHGFRWEDDIPRTKNKETLKPGNIPDDVRNVTDSILSETLSCIECGYNYRIVRSELDFYRQMSVPVPRKCFNCRHLARVGQRGSFKLYDRNCAKCNKGIKTVYPSDRPEIVYCESCYNAEVV
jgi:hypothetical protein